MKPSRLLISAGFVIAAALNVAAGEVKIICNVSVRADSISASELKSVFLLQRRTLKDGSPVVPVLEKSGRRTRHSSANTSTEAARKSRLTIRG